LAGGSGYSGSSAECGGGADDGAYIAGVLYAGQDHDERSCAVGGGSGDVVEAESARSDQGGDSLGMFGVSDAFEEAVGGEQDGDGDFGTIEILREASAVPFAGFAEEYGADGRGGAEGFFDEAWTFDADGAGFRRQTTTQCDAKFFQPAIVAASDYAGLRWRGARGVDARGHEDLAGLSVANGRGKKQRRI
jgi:hypothetical protein